jgi:hypothetical protein
MKVDIILHESNKGWIIEKIANRLAANLLSLGINSKLLDAPNFESDVTHWMHYLNVPLDLNISSINTMTVTHVDEIDKLEKLKFLIELGVYPIFLSNEHALEISNLLKIPTKFDKALPGSDLAIFNKIKFIINSNSYPDNRKNEDYLIRLARDLNLNQTIFIFCGKRWGEIGDHLSKAGAEVFIYSKEIGNYPSYESMNQITKDSDVFIYMGFDEGSMGALDAYLLNKKLIISDQGFHKEMSGRDVFLFKSYSEFKYLIEIAIKDHLTWQNEKLRWGWMEYAKSHLNIWNELISNNYLINLESNKSRSISKIARIYRVLVLSMNYNNHKLLIRTLKRLEFRKLINLVKKGRAK